MPEVKQSGVPGGYTQDGSTPAQSAEQANKGGSGDKEE